MREVDTFKLQLGGPLVLFVAVLTVLLPGMHAAKRALITGVSSWGTVNSLG